MGSEERSAVKQGSSIWSVLIMVLGVICLLTVVAWLLGADPLAPGNWSGQANEAIKPWRSVLMVCRWVMWCLLWWRWEQVGHWLFRGEPSIAEAQREQWGRMRNRMMGGIAAVESVILFSNIAGGQAWV